MSGDYSQMTEPTTAVRATLRDLLQAQITALELTPKWLWEMEFGLHVWPILERFHREGDEEAKIIVKALSVTPDVTLGVGLVKACITEEETPPW